MILDTCSSIDEFRPEFAKLGHSRARERVQSRDQISMTGLPACAELCVNGTVLRIQGFICAAAAAAAAA